MMKKGSNAAQRQERATVVENELKFVLCLVKFALE